MKRKNGCPNHSLLRAFCSPFSELFQEKVDYFIKLPKCSGRSQEVQRRAGGFDQDRVKKCSLSTFSGVNYFRSKFSVGEMANKEASQHDTIS